MLTEVKAYSSWPSAPTLILEEGGRPETDFLQILKITGLDPVKASVNTSPFGSIDGADYVGSSVLSRNIVLTVKPNPNWGTHTYESLRKLLYLYFMPKAPTRLVFYSDHMTAVAIDGIVESIENDVFSKDPQFIVSIICPDPYFTALEGVVLTGLASDAPLPVEYNGDIAAGIYVRVNFVSGTSPSSIAIQIGDASTSNFVVGTGVDANQYFEMSSVPMQKFAQTVNLSSGVITSRMSSVQEGYTWPVLQPGTNLFDIVTNAGVQNWELRYSERFGGL